jgi:hypothetical protein
LGRHRYFKSAFLEALALVDVPIALAGVTKNPKRASASNSNFSNNVGYHNFQIENFKTIQNSIFCMKFEPNLM